MRKNKSAEDVVNLLTKKITLNEEDTVFFTTEFAKLSKKGLNLLKERLLSLEEGKSQGDINEKGEQEI